MDSETAADPVSREFEDSVFHPQSPNSRILSVALADGNRTVAIPLAWSGIWSRSGRVRLFEAFKSFLLSPGKKIAHNLPYELTWLSYFLGDAILRGCAWTDTMAQAYALDERKGMLGLGTLTYIEFGLDIKKLNLADVAKLEEGSLQDGLLYNGVDAKYTYKLWKRQQARIEQANLTHPLGHLTRTSATIAQMQNKGILVDSFILPAIS